MEIGTKIQNARREKGLTQNELADMLGVSRQSISNWENNRSYPDIVSIVNMSDAFEISLDCLLKGDEKMINHLEESTNVVKAKNRYVKLVEILAYFIVWIICLAILYVNRMDYALSSNIIAYYVMPAVTFIASVLIGIGNLWEKEKRYIPCLFGAMQLLLMVAEYLFTLNPNSRPFNLFLVTAIGMGVLYGVVVSYAGVFISHIISNKKC